MFRILSSKELFSYAILKTDYALCVYRNFQRVVGTETKSHIGRQIGLKINGPVLKEFSNILSAKDETDNMKLLKVLQIGEGTSRHEITACGFSHRAIIAMKHYKIDVETAKVVRSRTGENDVVVMPWLVCSLNVCPSGDKKWISKQGFLIYDALNYIHSKGFVHADVKASNILVSDKGDWFLSDFGSCTRISETIQSSTDMFYFEDLIFTKKSYPSVDFFMFLVLILLENSVNRANYSNLFKDSNNHVDYDTVNQCANDLVSDVELGHLIYLLLEKIKN